MIRIRRYRFHRPREKVRFGGGGGGARQTDRQTQTQTERHGAIQRESHLKEFTQEIHGGSYGGSDVSVIRIS